MVVGDTSAEDQSVLAGLTDGAIGIQKPLLELCAAPRYVPDRRETHAKASVGPAEGHITA